MPRQARPAANAAGATTGGRTLFGRPWPLPFSPWAVGAVLLLVAVAGAAWYFEGRFESTPAEAQKRVLPYPADQVQRVVLTSPAGSVTYTRDATGKLTSGGPAPAPTPVPPPDAAPGPVQLTPATRLEGTLGQLAQLTIDREVTAEPSRSAEFGLDAPQMTIEVTSRNGGPATIAIGGQNPDGSAYYVRREGQSGPRDTVLVTRYTLDDLMKVAGELISSQG